MKYILKISWYINKYILKYILKYHLLTKDSITFHSRSSKNSMMLRLHSTNILVFAKELIYIFIYVSITFSSLPLRSMF